MSKASYYAPSVHNVVRLITLLCDSRKPLGISAISRATGINKNMTFRILNTLQKEGWIAMEEPGAKYRMTLVPFQIVSQPLHRLALREVAYGPLRRLWEKIGHCVYLDIVFEDQCLRIEQFNSTQTLRVDGMLGGRYPLYCTAPGKVLLAYADDQLLNRSSAGGFKLYTKNTLHNPGIIRTHLEQVRRQGYAVDNEEYSRGVLCFAAPVFDHTGKVVAAIGTTVTTILYSAQKLIRSLGPIIIKTGREISKQLGYQENTHHLLKRG